MEIKLGSKVRDKITGMEGVAICRTLWMNGCVRVGVQPITLKDGVPQDSRTFDEPDLEVVNETVASEAEPRHGPRPDAQSWPDAERTVA